ncbi:hypothetical protein BCAR13_1360003 [Paraburkholderia caribensis]|nr:hypothetical protein BCAR13_1360003 [Paraburkholderia caribensis]
MRRPCKMCRPPHFLPQMTALARDLVPEPIPAESADGRLALAGFLAGPIGRRPLAVIVVAFGHLAVFVVAVNRVLGMFDVAARAGRGCFLLLFATHETLPLTMPVDDRAIAAPVSPLIDSPQAPIIKNSLTETNYEQNRVSGFRTPGLATPHDPRTRIRECRGARRPRERVARRAQRRCDQRRKPVDVRFGRRYEREPLVFGYPRLVSGRIALRRAPREQSRYLPETTSFTLFAPAGMAVICVRVSRGPI